MICNILIQKCCSLLFLAFLLGCISFIFLSKPYFLLYYLCNYNHKYDYSILRIWKKHKNIWLLLQHHFSISMSSLCRSHKLIAVLQYYLISSIIVLFTLGIALSNVLFIISNITRGNTFLLSHLWKMSLPVLVLDHTFFNVCKNYVKSPFLFNSFPPVVQWDNNIHWPKNI